MYAVYVYNPDFTLFAQLIGYQRLEYHQRVNSPWNAQIDFTSTEGSELALFLRELGKLENRNKILYILRDHIKVYEGFITTVVDQTRNDGTILFDIYSQGFTSLLSWREVVPEDEYQIEEGPAETVLKSYVWRNFLGDRAFTNFNIEATSGAGGLITKNIRYNLVSSTVEAAAEEGGIDFGVVGSDPPGTFTLEARELWGTDRQDSVVFDLRLGNMTNPILSTNTKDEVNVVYVAADGVGEERIIYVLEDMALLVSSPWGRKEGYTSVRDATTIQAYRTAGLNYLADNTAEERLTFNVRQTDGCQWLEHYFLGDLVSAYYAGRQFVKKFVEIGVVVTTEGSERDEVINVEMQDA
jgi:hypothetical protein